MRNETDVYAKKNDGIEIVAVGGYDEVGRNMTAVRAGDTVVLLDMGVHLDKYIALTEKNQPKDISPKTLLDANAAPRIEKIKRWNKNVKAIIPSHAHLDHIGAIPYLSDKFEADILCSPYTGAVIKAILTDENMKLDNEIKVLATDSYYDLSQDIKVEFINMTHSVPDTVMVALHTKAGAIIYACDFKFDLTPTLGDKPNLKRLKELGNGQDKYKKGVLALIVDSTYSSRAGKMPSESVARELLKEVMLDTNSDGHAIIVTTFSSHLARLKTIIAFAKKLKRKVVLLGRSLSKYVRAGEEIELIDFSTDAEILGYGNQIRRKLKKIMAEGKDKYVLVVTGHQGEPEATLSKIINDKYDFKVEEDDIVIFSCTTIPTAANISNRKDLEKQLKKLGARVFTDIHSSGHGAREDIADLISMTKPKFVIPAHGSYEFRKGTFGIAKSLGYTKDKIIMLDNGESEIL